MNTIHNYGHWKQNINETINYNNIIVIISITIVQSVFLIKYIKMNDEHHKTHKL